LKRQRQHSANPPHLVDISQQDAERMVSEIRDRGEKLTDWEAAFIDDLHGRDHWITDKQREIVARIYQERVQHADG
jgi:hypothetical protein